jgi:glycosyltransferase involved in cell wall biosynthesis
VTVRILVVHNRYSDAVPSGENVSVDSEVAWLRDAGIEVQRLEVDNVDVLHGSPVTKARAAAETVWSPRSATELDAALRRFAPDLVHVHNLFPLLSGSVPARAIARGLPVVWTARNMRVTCVQGNHFRDGTDCSACRPGWRVPGIRHRCYRGSLPMSTLMTGATALFRRTARSQVTTIAISEALRTWLVDEAGFDPARVHVKYNGMAAPDVEVSRPPSGGDEILYVGKFTAFKGIELLLDAWQTVRDPSVRLTFLGGGPLADRVAHAAEADDRITWAGQVPAADVAPRIAQARAVVVPSIWSEPFGRVVAEAFALGRPVITTGRGALAEIVGPDAGWVTGDAPADLAAAIDAAAESDAAVDSRGAAGRVRHSELFSPAATTDRLLAIYESALTAARRTTVQPS